MMSISSLFSSLWSPPATTSNTASTGTASTGTASTGTASTGSGFAQMLGLSDAPAAPPAATAAAPSAGTAGFGPSAAEIAARMQALLSQTQSTSAAGHMLHGHHAPKAVQDDTNRAIRSYTANALG